MNVKIGDKQYELRSSNETGGHLSLLQHLKKLPGEKDALFARVKYLQQGVDQAGGQMAVKDVDDIHEEQQEEG